MQRVGADEAKDHYRPGRRRARRNGPAVDVAADPVAADRSPGNHSGDGRSVAARGSGTHVTHDRTHRANRHSSRPGGGLSTAKAKTGYRAMGATVRFRALAGRMDAEVLSSGRPVGRDA